MSCSLQDYNTRGFRLSVRMLLTSISGKRRTGNSVSTRTHYAGTSNYNQIQIQQCIKIVPLYLFGLELTLVFVR